MSTSSSGDQHLGTNIPVAPVVCGGLAIFGIVILVGGILLHRRHQRKLYQEDIDTQHSPADYGLCTEQHAVEKYNYSESLSRQSQVSSVDFSGPSPYLSLVSASLQSRESLNTIVQNEAALQPYSICQTVTRSAPSSPTKASNKFCTQIDGSDPSDGKSCTKDSESSPEYSNCQITDPPNTGVMATINLPNRHTKPSKPTTGPVCIQNKVRESILEYEQFSAQDYSMAIDSLEVGWHPRVTLAAPLAISPRVHKALEQSEDHSSRELCVVSAPRQSDNSGIQRLRNTEATEGKVAQSVPEPDLPLKNLPLSPSQVDLSQTLYFAPSRSQSRSASPLTLETSYKGLPHKARSPFFDSSEKLSALPSPYHLRQSGAFSTLGFAPASRTRLAETTYLSPSKVNAGRLSRIGTLPMKENLGELLKPSWQQAR